MPATRFCREAGSFKERPAGLRRQLTHMENEPGGLKLGSFNHAGVQAGSSLRRPEHVDAPEPEEHRRWHDLRPEVLDEHPAWPDGHAAAIVPAARKELVVVPARVQQLLRLHGPVFWMPDAPAAVERPPQRRQPDLNQPLLVQEQGRGDEIRGAHWIEVLVLR